MDTRVPRFVSPALRALSQVVVPGSEPEFVACDPVDIGAFNDCFPTVERRVDSEGGSLCVGWALWEWPGVMVEAEFHATWRSPSGALKDIVPRLLPVERIMFLPDPNRSYEGKQVDNVRLPLSASPLVSDLIAVCERQFLLMNRGARAQQHGEIVLEGGEAAEWQSLAATKEHLVRQIRLTTPRLGRNDLCWCGSGRKFKKCCGP